MPNREDMDPLRHMLDAARKSVAFAGDRSRADLDAHEMFALALVRLLEVLGEAAKQVSQEFRGSHDGIAWKQIAGTRDRLIHGYFDVDLDIVWAIVTVDLPPLISELEQMLGAPSESGS